MAVTRINKGKPAGLFVAEIGGWNLAQTADGRYKVYSREPVNGKANYAFGVKEGAIDSHVGLDCTKLKEERPELYGSLVKFFKAQMAPPPDRAQAEEEADLYGDLALSRRHKLTSEQNWRRTLLQFRRIELEHAAAQKEGIWESAVRMTWAVLFGTKISETEEQRALHWIKQRAGTVNLGMLMQIETDYYAGRFAPNSSLTLEAQLDLLTNNNSDFDNVEEAIDGRETNVPGPSEGTSPEQPVRDGSIPEEDPLAAFL